MARQDNVPLPTQQQEIFELRARYYNALREGMTPADAARYANGGGKATVTKKVETKPTTQPFKPIPKQPPTPDDLTKINGIGPLTVKKLNDMGVTSYAQIAEWTTEEAERYDKLFNMRGRILREDWVGQAKALT